MDFPRKALGQQAMDVLIEGIILGRSFRSQGIFSRNWSLIEER